MRVLLALTLLVMAHGQDDESVRALARRLEADGLEEREAAFEALVKLGPTGVPALTRVAADDRLPETIRLKLREAIVAIDLAARIEPRRITLRHDGTLGAAFDEVARQAGIVLKKGDVKLDAPLRLDMKDVSLFQALDALCEGRADCSWQWDGSGIVLRRERQKASPSAYIAAFRVQVAAVTVCRTSDFADTTSRVFLSMSAQGHPDAHPVGRLRVNLTGGTDQAGRDVSFATPEADELVLPGLRVPLPMDPLAPDRFVAGVAADARSLSRVKATLTARFGLGSESVALESPAVGVAKDLGECRVRIKSKHKDGYTLAFSWSGDPDELAERFDASSVTAVDSDGRETKAVSVTRIAEGGAGGLPVVVKAGESWHRVVFGALGSDVKAVRFKFVTKVVEKQFNFEIREIPLP
jgi:hypothetical protein